MTHDLLQSDIDLAKRLRGDHRADEEIITALVNRGIDPAQAALLLDDLRSGRKAAPQTTAHLEFTPARRSRSKRAAHGGAPNPPTPFPRVESRRERPPRPTGHGPKTPTAVWVIIAVLFGAVLVAVGVVLFQRSHSKARLQDEPQPRAAQANTDTSLRKSPAPATPTTTAGSLILELRPDGLHLGDSLVNRGNLLGVAAKSLGVPTRTNRVAQTETVVYAYDRQGLLIYSQKGGATNSIVLDYEAAGGANGTTSPFGGVLRIEDRVIGPDTDPQTLFAIKSLDLKGRGDNSSILGGRYNNCEVVFAYENSSRRLRLVEIDVN